MGLLKKVISGGSNKNDVKIAKLELEKAKIENAAQSEKVFQAKQKNKKLEKANIVDSYLEYSKNNFDKIQNVILTLKSDIEMMKSKIQSYEDARLTFKEKSQLKKEKSSCEDKLQYLYLSKDYLMYLSKYENGIDLNEEQTSLIVKFARYFDGVQVIEIEEYGDEDDEDNEGKEDVSIVGMLKESLKNEFREAFSNSKKASKFYFSEYLVKYYYDKINQLEIPEVASVMGIFKKTIVSKNENTELIKDPIDSIQNINECPNCNSKISANVKFCPDCGIKIEIPKPMVCEECSSSLVAGAKFCPECGHKVY
jgi:hypothetical protein